jgi:hypothetical protein
VANVGCVGASQDVCGAPATEHGVRGGSVLLHTHGKWKYGTCASTHAMWKVAMRRTPRSHVCGCARVSGAFSVRLAAHACLSVLTLFRYSPCPNRLRPKGLGRTQNEASYHG